VFLGGIGVETVSLRRVACVLSAVLVVALSSEALSVEAGQVMYTKDNAPTAPAVGELPMQKAVSQYGITWMFEKPVPVGQFVNGDYYVVGPATVVSITPPPENGRNGSMLNVPLATGWPNATAWDDRTKANRYDAQLRTPLPIRMKPGDALISTISVNEIGEVPKILWHTQPISPVKTAAVLTCVAQPLPADAFRPAWADRGQKLFFARSLRRELLPSLERVPHTPDIAEYVSYVQRPWIEWTFDGYTTPLLNMPVYGREVFRVVGTVPLLLCCDFTPTEKEKLLVPFVQVGIDLWGMVRAGYPGWQAHGGHHQGRKMPIVFAGYMLNDADMMSPRKKYPDILFTSDTQTMFGDCWTGAKVVYAGHMGKDGHPTDPDNPRYAGWGAYEHLHPKDWVSDLGESYRRCCTSNSWVGAAMAIRILHLEKIWAHDAFPAYVDRWMNEDDTEPARIIEETRGRTYDSYQSPGGTWDPFHKEMYRKYRNNLPPAPDGSVTPPAEETWR